MRAKLVLVLLAVLFFILFAAAREGPEQKAARSVGENECTSCHDFEPVYSRTPHAKVECETCHGPGSEHVENGGGMTLSFTNKPARWTARQCMACHQKETDVFALRASAHGDSSISCASCHQVHPERPNFGLLKGDQKSACGGCHQATMADFRKPFHHPLLEGAMKCTDCHSPHAEERRPLRRLAVGTEEGCVSCHSDKKGPFVFEHGPLQIEGCESCHQPHGSVNPKMLRRSQAHQLCLECHSLTPDVAGKQPPAFHDLRTARFRNCTTCHREIHGSNASALFLK